MNNRSKKAFHFHENMLFQLLRWAAEHEHFSFLNGNDHTTLHGSFPKTIFVGKINALESNSNSFEKLKTLCEKENDWIYGYFSYDLKNEIEDLESNNPVTVPVNHLGFYIPETIVNIQNHEIIIDSIHDPAQLIKQINNFSTDAPYSKTDISAIKALTPKWQYIDHIHSIKKDIIDGEFYEMNYCMEFNAEADTFNTLSCYLQLNAISPMPFSTFSRFGNIFLICASPERFLKKHGDKIISQPIKGTTRRSFDKVEDEYLAKSLHNSEKERAENLMIVDLVRNDLAKSAFAGSVKVDELFEIYTFKKVHQMISSVSARHNPSVDITNIVKHAFPMGSMTGAPKIRVMEEIDALEISSRGMYSGAVGYFHPCGNFDFNVVIRSIIYDADSNKISFHVGSAITHDSDPENEYNECLLKAEALMQALS